MVGWLEIQMATHYLQVASKVVDSLMELYLQVVASDVISRKRMLGLNLN